eukprot:jgi/Botrbrau1/20518/Bobra.145_2s0071.1
MRVSGRQEGTGEMEKEASLKPAATVGEGGWRESSLNHALAAATVRHGNASETGRVGTSSESPLPSPSGWIQTLFGLGSKLEQLSPFSFYDGSLERDFLAIQRSNGADLATLHFVFMLGFACMMSRMLSTSELPRAIGFCITPLLGLAFKFAFPASFHAHIQAINAITKLAGIATMLPTAKLLLETRKEGPLTPVVFLHVYLVETHVIGIAIANFGAWQAFLPNLATSLLIFALQISRAPACCARWGPAADPDLALLSLFPKTLNVLTAGFAPTPALPWVSDPSQSCVRNVAAPQLLGGFLVNFILLVCEARSRCAFLKKNAGRLGGGGAARAAVWPFEGILGLRLCLNVVAAHLAGLCLIWSLLLALGV